jgi:hypothetical protein
MQKADKLRNSMLRSMGRLQCAQTLQARWHAVRTTAVTRRLHSQAPPAAVPQCTVFPHDSNPNIANLQSTKNTTRRLRH